MATKYPDSYIELKISTIVTDSCTWVNFTLFNVLGRDGIIIANINKYHKLYRVIRDLILDFHKNLHHFIRDKTIPCVLLFAYVDQKSLPSLLEGRRNTYSITLFEYKSIRICSLLLFL